MQTLADYVAPYMSGIVQPLQRRDPMETVAKYQQVAALVASRQQPQLGASTPGNMISWGGATLAPQAMQSFQAVAARFGGIPLSSSYRSIAKQAALYRDYLAGKHPAQVAPPGQSLHNKGLAIDVDTGWLKRNPGAVAALRAAGWYQFDPKNEPWHFSYGVVG